MDRNTERAIEWDCQQLLVRYYDAFDRWDYAAMSEMFTPDGVWHRAGKALTGLGLVAELEKRPKAQQVRHVLTNILVTPRDAEHADLRAYLTCYRNADVTRAPSDQKIRGPFLMLLVTAKCVLTTAGWRLEEQVMKREFEFEELVP